MLLFLFKVVSFLVNSSVEVLSAIHSSADFKFKRTQVWSKNFAVLAPLLTLNIKSFNLLEIFSVAISQTLQLLLCLSFLV
jgi:hypothetical protein